MGIATQPLAEADAAKSRVSQTIDARGIRKGPWPVTATVRRPFRLQARDRAKLGTGPHRVLTLRTALLW